MQREVGWFERPPSRRPTFAPPCHGRPAVGKALQREAGGPARPGKAGARRWQCCQSRHGWQCIAEISLRLGKAVAKRRPAISQALPSRRAVLASRQAAEARAVLGKPLPSRRPALALPCQGRPAGRQRIAEGGRLVCKAVQNALPLAAGGLARHCQGKPAAWQGLAKRRPVVGKALPRATGGLARHCQGKPATRQCLAKRRPAVGKALPRAAGG